MYPCYVIRRCLLYQIYTELYKMYYLRNLMASANNYVYALLRNQVSHNAA